MFCSKCGKQIDYEATVCHECRGAEKTAESGYYYADAATYAPTEPVAPVESTRMVGFGRALTATILGFVAYVLSLIGLALFVLPVAGLVLSTMSLAMGIVSLVLGVQSIKTFKALKNGPGGSPIATLILGIVGVVWAGFTLLFAALAALLVILVLVGLLI